MQPGESSTRAATSGPETPCCGVPMVNCSGLASIDAPPTRQLRILGEGQAHLELGCLDVEPFVAQRVRHVVDAGVVPGGTERAVAVVASAIC